jgi:2-oxoglutarate dehydrogenase E2 component (dihydrolipoamide succinyltransferase)
MSTEVRIPNVGESVVEVQVGQWLVKEGDAVAKDQPIVELETDKATVELPCPVAGVVEKLLKSAGDTARVDEAIATIDESRGGQEQGRGEGETGRRGEQESARQREGAGAREESQERKTLAASQSPKAGTPIEKPKPARSPQQRPTPVEPRPEPVQPKPPQPAQLTPQPQPSAPGPRGEEEIVPMTPIRRRIAERLVAAQHAAALLTTFNEIDCSAIQQLRHDYQESFQQRFGIKLGLMSFFVKATVEALKQVPQLNAEIRGTDIAFRNYYDIGIAVAGGKGLVVPVIRNAERLGFADVERVVADFAERARANRIELAELEGGTFTITNGGVFGSLLSTPIINPPQSGVLGLHAIQDRPVVRDGHIVIRPMMYVALTYDHRMVDGREAVGFLRHVKDIIENPSRMLLEV